MHACIHDPDHGKGPMEVIHACMHACIHDPDHGSKGPMEVVHTYTHTYKCMFYTYIATARGICTYMHTYIHIHICMNMFSPGTTASKLVCTYMHTYMRLSFTGATASDHSRPMWGAKHRTKSSWNGVKRRRGTAGDTSTQTPQPTERSVAERENVSRGEFIMYTYIDVNTQSRRNEVH